MHTGKCSRHNKALRYCTLPQNVLTCEFRPNGIESTRFVLFELLGVTHLWRNSVWTIWVMICTKICGKKVLLQGNPFPVGHGQVWKRLEGPVLRLATFSWQFLLVQSMSLIEKCRRTVFCQQGVAAKESKQQRCLCGSWYGDLTALK